MNKFPICFYDVIINKKNREKLFLLFKPNFSFIHQTKKCFIILEEEKYVYEGFCSTIPDCLINPVIAKRYKDNQILVKLPLDELEIENIYEEEIDIFYKKYSEVKNVEKEREKIINRFSLLDFED